MSKKYDLTVPPPIKDLIFNFTVPNEVKEIPLNDLGKYRMPWRCYVILNFTKQTAKLTFSYHTWLKEVAELYMLNPERTDVSCFRVMRGVRPKFKAAMYIS